MPSKMQMENKQSDLGLNRLLRPTSEIQIRRENMNNLEIIIQIIKQNIICDPLLELARQDGSNEGSQHIF